MNNFIFDDNPFFTEKAPEGWMEAFSQRLGKRRLMEIQSRMHLEEKTLYHMRDLAKIVIGASDVTREDMLEVLLGEAPLHISKEFTKYNSPEEMTIEDFDRLYKILSTPFGQENVLSAKQRQVEKRIHELVHFTFSCVRYDPYWFAKRRTKIAQESHQLNQLLYYERMSGFYAACEDLQVGLYLPAPRKEGIRQYYRVSAHLITGAGQIGMILVSASNSMKLKTLRVTRGSPSPPGTLDFVSHVITDMEPEIGRIGYESGLFYQPMIDQHIGNIDVEIGYSIGGTIAQWRAAENPQHLSSLWLYKSPGVPRSVWEKFNEKTRMRKDPLELYIFQAKGDIVDFAGDVPLGYKAHDKVQVSLYELVVPGLNPHKYSFSHPDKIQIEEVESLFIDEFLSRKSKTFIERQRKKIGKYFVLPILGFWKKYLGEKIPNRIHQLKGLRIEEFDASTKEYRIKHYPGPRV